MSLANFNVEAVRDEDNIKELQVVIYCKVCNKEWSWPDVAGLSALVDWAFKHGNHENDPT